MRLLSLTFLLLLLSSQVSAQPTQSFEKELPRFKTLARTIADSVPSERPDPKLTEAMDILLRAAWQIKRAEPKITDTKLLERLNNFSLAAKQKQKDDFVTSPTHFDLNTVRSSNRVAITITYGPVSRLAVFDTLSGHRLPVVKTMTWLYPWHLEPTFNQDGSLLILFESVQDMGNRIGRRVDTLIEHGGKWQHVQSFIRQSCFDIEPSIELKGNRLTV